MAHITCWERSPILSLNIPVGFFCAKNHTRLLHWPQQNKNFMLYSRKNRLKSVPGKLTLCNVPCQWEEWSLAQRRCCQKGVWIFLPESWHHAFYLFLDSFAMLKGKKRVNFFLCSAGVSWCFILPKEPLWSQERGCRQCSHATWMEGCYLCILETFLPQSFYLSPSNPFRDLCLCLSVQQKPRFNWNNSEAPQGMEFILTIRNVCFSLPPFARRAIMALCRTTHSSPWVCHTLIPFWRDS